MIRDLLKRLARRAFAGRFPEKSQESRGLPKVFLDFKDDTGLPANLPTPRDLRVLAAFLMQSNPAAEALGLAQAKRYELIHELAGFHDAIASIHNIADTLEEAEQAAQDEAQVLPAAA